MEQDVRKEFEAAVEVLRKRGSVECSLLFGGEGVEFAAYAVDAVQDVVGPTVFGPFEYGMFYKMGYALFGPLFIPRTYVYVYTRMGHYRIVLSEDDADTVIESMILIHVDGVVLF